jgi:hypothetical protein
MKKNVLLFAVMLLMSSLAVAQDYHWPLKANLDDVVGGKNGTNFGVTFENDATRGNVAVFSGDSYAKLPSFVNGLTEITVAIWYRMDEKRVWSRIYSFGKGDQSEPKDVMMVIPTSGRVEPDSDPAHNMYRFTLSDPSGPWADIDFTKAEVDVQLNTWYQSTVVLKPDSIILYHNNTQIFAESGFTRPIGTLEDIENALGKSFWPDNLWKGALSDLKVWKKALTKAEVIANYNGTSNAISNRQADKLSMFGFNNHIFIENNAATQNAQVSVINLAGITIAKKSIEEIREMNFRNGMYLVQVNTTKGDVFTGKVLVK